MDRARRDSWRPLLHPTHSHQKQNTTPPEPTTRTQVFKEQSEPTRKNQSRARTPPSNQDRIRHSAIFSMTHANQHL